MRDKKKSLTNVAGAGSVLCTVSGPSSAVLLDNFDTSSPLAKRLLEKTLGAQNLTGAKSWLFVSTLYSC
ncbi:MAG: hypothetical protein V4732_03235 [Pseudomonadota bacterium]